MTVAPWEGSYAHCDCLIGDPSILPLFHGTHRYAPAIVVFRFLPQMSFTSHDKKDVSVENLLLRLAFGCGLLQSLLYLGCGAPRFWLESRP